jgi:hypothetical protein
MTRGAQRRGSNATFCSGHLLFEAGSPQSDDNRGFLLQLKTG